MKKESNTSLIIALWMLVVGLILTLFLGQNLIAALSDSSAMGKAITIWGPHAAIAKYRKTGATYWTMQLGCELDDGTFHIVATGVNTWDDAFTRVDMAHNGKRYITATATQTDGQKTVSPMILVYACNALGLPVAEFKYEEVTRLWKLKKQFDVFMNDLMP